MIPIGHIGDHASLALWPDKTVQRSATDRLGGNLGGEEEPTVAFRLDRFNELRGEEGTGCRRRVEKSRFLTVRGDAVPPFWGRAAGGRGALRSRRAWPPAEARPGQLGLRFPSAPSGVRGT